LKSLLSRKSGLTQDLEEQPDLAKLEWEAFCTRKYMCKSCGEIHNGHFEIAFLNPDVDNPPKLQNNNEVEIALLTQCDFLSEDFCLLGEDRFIRTVLPLPIAGTDQSFCIALWSTVNPKKFHFVLENFDSHEQGSMEPMFSWLGNHLEGAPRKPVRSHIHFQNNRQRPMVWIDDEDHPYFAKQRDGITPKELLEIYRLFGHDFNDSYTTDS
jgi:hypothetical protein